MIMSSHSALCPPCNSLPTAMSLPWPPGQPFARARQDSMGLRGEYWKLHEKYCRGQRFSLRVTIAFFQISSVGFPRGMNRLYEKTYDILPLL